MFLFIIYPDQSVSLLAMSVIRLVKRTPKSAFTNVMNSGWRWGEPEYFSSKLYGADVGMAFWDLGSRNAKETILLTHGEPSWSYLYRRMIDPLLAEGYRVVLFDQRGCGKSTPRGSLEGNDTPSLVADCEALRRCFAASLARPTALPFESRLVGCRHLGVERWDLVLGGSWGVTLALAYAARQPI